MPPVMIERANLPTEMRDALKKHILRERQKKKEEADANEADKQRRREEKAKALSSSKVQLEDNAKSILQLERTIAELQQQKSEQYNLLKRALTEEDRRKHSQQTLSKEPSWTSLYPPSKKSMFNSNETDLFVLIDLQMPQYAPHHQHYLSTQPSHRLLAYKPPPQPPQPQSFIPTTSATNVSSKRTRSPSNSHIYSSPSGKSSRIHPSNSPLLILFDVIHSIISGPPSPGSSYSSSSSQVSRNAGSASAVGYASPQTQSAFSPYMNYMPPSTASYANQMTRVRGPPQMSSK